MQRFVPIITIWVVEFTDKNYGNSYVNISLSGESLYLW